MISNNISIEFLIPYGINISFLIMKSLGYLEHLFFRIFVIVNNDILIITRKLLKSEHDHEK